MSKTRGRPDLPGAKPETRQPLAELTRVSVECVLAEVPTESYCPRHVELQLDVGQATTLRRLVEGLDLDGARLASGRRITTGPDALRFVLEAVCRETAN